MGRIQKVWMLKCMPRNPKKHMHNCKKDKKIIRKLQCLYKSKEVIYIFEAIVHTALKRKTTYRSAP